MSSISRQSEHGFHGKTSANSAGKRTAKRCSAVAATRVNGDMLDIFHRNAVLEYQVDHAPNSRSTATWRSQFLRIPYRGGICTRRLSAEDGNSCELLGLSSRDCGVEKQEAKHTAAVHPRRAPDTRRWTPRRYVRRALAPPIHVAPVRADDAGRQRLFDYS